MTIAVAIALALISSSLARVQQKENGSNPSQSKMVTFADTIGPLLKKNCMPCHFEGGKVYDKYPFDTYETARALGKRLNTRLKGENAEFVSRWIKNGSLNSSADSLRKP